LAFAVGSVGMIVGSLASGWLLQRIGLTGCLIVQAVSFAGILSALAAIRPRPRRRQKKPTHPLHELWLGVLLALSRRDIYTNLIMLALMAILQQGFRAVMLPVLAKNLFAGDATLNGYFFAANGLGMFLGSSAVASAAKKRHQGAWMMTGAFIGAGALALLAIAPNAATALLFVVAMGASWFVFGSPSNSAVQLAAGPRYRSRVLSLHILICAAANPVGGFFYTTASDLLSDMPQLGALAGPRGAMLAGAVATVCVALTLGVAMARMDNDQ
jgi:MFS family permease